MKIPEILSRCWSDGGFPPEGTTVRVGNKTGEGRFKNGRIDASPYSLESYCEKHSERSLYYSPVVKLDTGENITSAIVIDIDGGTFNSPDIIPFATVHTGNGEHAYVALNGLHLAEAVQPIAEAVNIYCGGDRGAHCSGEYLRRYFEGYNYKTVPPLPVNYETTPRLVKYTLNDLARRAGYISEALITEREKKGISIIEPASPAVFEKLNALLSKDFPLSRIYTGAGYQSTSEASFALALALFYRGFTKPEAVRIILNAPAGIAFSKNNNREKEHLLARATRIVEKAFEKIPPFMLSPEVLALYGASSRNRGRGISEMKLWKLTGLSKPDFDKGLAILKDAGLAYTKRERKGGRNSRRIVYIGATQKNLFAGNDFK